MRTGLVIDDDVLAAAKQMAALDSEFFDSHAAVAKLLNLLSELPGLRFLA
jgi:hypothetical protein